MTDISWFLAIAMAMASLAVLIALILERAIRDSSDP